MENGSSKVMIAALFTFVGLVSGYFAFAYPFEYAHDRVGQPAQLKAEYQTDAKIIGAMKDKDGNVEYIVSDGNRSFLAKEVRK